MVGTRLSQCALFSIGLTKWKKLLMGEPILWQRGMTKCSVVFSEVDVPAPRS